MPWGLTTPVQVGDLDPNGPYAQAKIIEMRHSSKGGYIELVLEYGNTDGEGNWIPGIPPAGKPTFVRIDGQSYADFITANQATYDAVAQTLYDKLVADEKLAAGSMV